MKDQVDPEYFGDREGVGREEFGRRPVECFPEPGSDRWDWAHADRVRFRLRGDGALCLQVAVDRVVLCDVAFPSWAPDRHREM